MRILVDLQGAQTESRFHGIGRYSLEISLALARSPRDHEIWLLLNGAFDDSVRELRRAFADLVPAERIATFYPPGTIEGQTEEPNPRYRVAEQLRAHLIRTIDPDCLLVTGLIQTDTVTRNTSADVDERTATIVYDLIPWLNQDYYLALPGMRRYFTAKMDELARTGLLLAISESSRQEAITELAADPEHVVNIRSAAGAQFSPGPATDPADLAAVGVSRPFVLYTPSGYDKRKNLEGLITAFGRLPAHVREGRQLVIASKFTRDDTERLRARGRESGLAGDDVVFTGYVTDDQLIALYRSTELFVYPSLHEGFGLPALEAMACGAPVIGSNCTSVPEVIGREDALFDPTDVDEIARRIEAALGDADFREELRRHGPAQAATFSWEASADAALDAIERRFADRTAAVPPTPSPARESLAWVSPLPPVPSGISDYSADLLGAMSERFDVTLICDQDEVDLEPALDQLPQRDAGWFAVHAPEFDHVVYQVGNSDFHTFMLPLLRIHPGIVVLHDFFVSGVLWYDQLHRELDGVWDRAVLASHGDVRSRIAVDETLEKTYPANLPVLNAALGVIVHSQLAKGSIEAWHGSLRDLPVDVVPLVRREPREQTRAKARAELGIDPDAFLVCSFGSVFYPKLDLELVRAWLGSQTAADPRAELHLVGPLVSPDYAQQLAEFTEASEFGTRVRLTDRVSREDYERYLVAADVAVQLRASSRGETSAATLDCLNHGLATIVNAHGTAVELPSEAVVRLGDQFSPEELGAAIDALRDDSEERERLAAAGRDLLRQHRPEAAVDRYADLLALAGSRRASHRSSVLRGIVSAVTKEERRRHGDEIAQAVARSVSMPLEPRQVLVDTTGTGDWPGLDLADELVLSAPHAVHVLFVRTTAHDRPQPPTLLLGHPRPEPRSSAAKPPLLADVRCGDALLFLSAAAFVASESHLARTTAGTSGARLAVLVDSPELIGACLSRLGPSDAGLLCTTADVFEAAEAMAGPHQVPVALLEGPEPETAAVRHVTALVAAG